MSATVIGNISFGLTAETGLHAAAITFDYSIQEKWIGDADGDDIAGALFKAGMTFNIEGAFSTTGSPTWTLGSQLVIANIPTHTAYIPGYTSGGRVNLLGVNLTLGNESEQRRTLSGNFKPFAVTA